LETAGKTFAAPQIKDVATATLMILLPSAQALTKGSQSVGQVIRDARDGGMKRGDLL
jgi:hypothetical protein